ncbi:MAG: DUF481 domain-containing protein [Candidatus Andeanibacterium colombiense]|uniref:DUF481 domain-containing protein n=1 Tax=Candidatus Andeanibacterium colombiense TaxID=3121345 RepID=A0AAJ5X708_9SPHN|nr:MAG: DUF481 domain-containing protein [Sphingomonadaceae bacterium]
MKDAGRYFAVFAAVLAAGSSPALAELPQPVRAMVDAAIATGDAKKVATVIEIAKSTNPDDGDELDALKADFDGGLRRLAEEAAKKREAQVRSAGLFRNWSGKGEVGAFQSSGNSNNTGIAIGLELNRKGIDWSHKLRASLDYQRSNGVTSREQVFASYEPRFQIDDGLFAYGLAQYDRDRFQGFLDRYAISGGLGYKLIDRKRISLSAQLGPAYRSTVNVDGSSDSRLAGLAALDFDWQITDRLKLTQDTNMVAETGSRAAVLVDANNTTVTLTTGLEAKVSKHLSTRFSFKLDYDSDPLARSVSTDTLSRFTLLYGF